MLSCRLLPPARPPGDDEAEGTSAYSLKGEIERAAAELAEARRLKGAGSFSSIARLRAGGLGAAPKIRALVEATYFAGLRKAGMPEE
jgi:hypothetical protein